MTSKELIKEAKLLSFHIHRNQTYDVFPYKKHIIDVINVLESVGAGANAIIGGYLHDAIEDGNLTYNKIRKLYGEVVADIVLAVTDPLDVKTRGEKKAIVYRKIQACPEALEVKLADRIANIRHGVRTRNIHKLTMYLHESEEFHRQLSVIPKFHALWELLDGVLREAEVIACNNEVSSKS